MAKGMSYYCNGKPLGLAFGKKCFHLSSTFCPIVTVQTCSGILNLGIDRSHPFIHRPEGYYALPCSSGIKHSLSGITSLQGGSALYEEIAVEPTLTLTARTLLEVW